MIAGILGKIAGPALGRIFGVIDKAVKDKDLAAKLKAETQVAMLEFDTKELKAVESIIVAEAQGNFLQRNWRPFTMMVFLGLVVSYWFGYARDIPEPIIEELFFLIQIGLAGYVVGRSGEKIAKSFNGKH